MFPSHSDEQLEGEIATLASRIAADTCRWLLLVAEFDRREAHVGLGFHCCAAWLAWRCSVAPRAAREHVRVARRLSDLPLVRAAFERAELSYSKVRAITRVEEPAVEADLLELARCATAAQLDRIVQGFRGALAAADGRAAVERRHFSHSWGDDGSLSFRGRLAPEEGAMLLRALEAGIELADDRPADPSGRPSRADALVTMAESLLAHGVAARDAGERHQVVVHVDAVTLAGHGEGGPRPAGGPATATPEAVAAPAARTASGAAGAACCRVEGGPTVSAETARKLACDGSLVTMLEGPDGTLHVGRRTRAIPPSIRRALRSRDRGCRFPGCPNHRWVDGHHISHWAQGGETRLDNLVQLCRRHHTLVHERGFDVRRDADGRLTFRRPCGTKIPNSPSLPPPDDDRARPGGRPRPPRPSPVVGPIPLPIDAGAPMDLHLAVAGLAESARPEGPDGPRRAPP